VNDTLKVHMIAEVVTVIGNQDIVFREIDLSSSLLLLSIWWKDRRGVQELLIY